MQTFKKGERLRNKERISFLYNKGRALTVHPFRLIWMKMTLDSDFPLQIAISVPKKNIRKAVVRNKIKRRIRETYRKNKQGVYEFLQKNNHDQYAIMLIYLEKAPLEYKDIESKLILTLQRFMKEHEKFDK